MYNQNPHWHKIKILGSIATFIIFGTLPLYGKPRVLVPQTTIPVVAFSSDGKALVAGEEPINGIEKGKLYFNRSHLRLWNAKNLKLQWIREDSPFSASKLAFSPDSPTLVAGFSNGMALWNVQTGKKIRTLFSLKSIRPMTEIQTVTYWPDNKTIALTGSSEGGPADRSQIFLYDAFTGELKQKLQYKFTTPKRCVSTTVLSPNGQLVAASNSRLGLYAEIESPQTRKDAEVWIWNTAGQVKHVFKTGQISSDFLLFSPDSRMLAVAEPGKKTIGIWNVQTGKLVRNLTDNHLVRPMAFSPDSRILATASGDWRIKPKLWNIKTGKVIKSIEYSSPVLSMAFSPNGRTLALGGHNGVKVVRIK